ncbi:hypothetical protein N7450_004576 [Penicillium hetheringtonii]|uniref:Uncharacterized protein n=1 Tax=Penicillium hetheringtonii TaxID=911720 RepID=A0AAD6DRR4_9EURO|nr:hypothetical protein N7450_004576 [Penicillium hetheringtonii]
MGESQSHRPENRRSPPPNTCDVSSMTGPSTGAVPERVGKEDVMITLSLSPETTGTPSDPIPFSPIAFTFTITGGNPRHAVYDARLLVPGLDSRGRYIFINGRGMPTNSPADSTKRPIPLQMRADDHIETRLGSLNISETISENAELDTTPKSPSSHASGSPVLMPQTFPRMSRMRSTSPLHFQHPMNSPSPIHTSPTLGGKYNESYPIHSSSSTSSVPSTPSSIRSRSPSISSLETIPDIPDAEAEALEDEGRIAELKAAADAADVASNTNRRRGISDTSSPSSSFGVVRGGSSAYAPRSDKRKRWSVCGAERRQDLDLETIWED